VVIPDGISVEAAGALEESLSSTVELLTRAPSEVTESVLAASRIAFTEALSVTCIVAGVLCVIAAVVAFRVLPDKAHEVEPADH
jgi:DHA2 family multidrug resistance protein-like MFS transporter